MDKELKAQFETFLEFKSNFENDSSFESLDEYGFAIGTPLKDNIDLLITGLIHGNEVIGIEIINMVCQKLLGSQIPCRIGFLLGNIEAAKQNVRKIETDLNRSFLVKESKTLEHERAKQIEKTLDMALFTLDLHQTIEPTESPFFIFEHREESLRLAHFLLPEIPIVTFAPGSFSSEGKTLLEYAAFKGNKALCIECGAKGFDAILSKTICDTVFKLIENIVNNNGLDNLDYEKIEIPYTFLVSSVENREGRTLKENLASHQLIPEGELLANDGEGEFLAPFDARVYFPRYGHMAQGSPILCNLGQDKVLKAD